MSKVRVVYNGFRVNRVCVVGYVQVGSDEFGFDAHRGWEMCRADLNIHIPKKFSTHQHNRIRALYHVRRHHGVV